MEVSPTPSVSSSPPVTRPTPVCPTRRFIMFSDVASILFHKEDDSDAQFLRLQIVLLKSVEY
ncbi:hypothetical protein E2C01_018911 [Portunus trituberculatus]|uniref:Uncharacterized protein n=1 Tax=Portunus trituberculatus TaxID=210409 RepID=A0A5B7DXH0_PORTR|nr:hypothetical protein [Portunus trituberculatus]